MEMKFKCECGAKSTMETIVCEKNVEFEKDEFVDIVELDVSEGSVFTLGTGNYGGLDFLFLKCHDCGKRIAVGMVD